MSFFSPISIVAILLVCSNTIMSFAWYGNLKTFPNKPLLFVIVVSWGIAFFEYMFVIPANRIGFEGGLNLFQLKIMQEVITLAVFVPFAVFYMKQSFNMNFVYASLCMVAAVYFMFKN
ncbi:MAG: DMT family protein [Alphaproteobacteria bacterium]|jgi:uncharacterized protein (DUF486 family)|nr:DMT family protein [Alphaproteobacteria bacterium]